MAIGVLVRAFPVIVAGSVVGDGGFVHAMVSDIRASGIALPSTASYNDLAIPFVYPPLALLVGAVIGDALGLPTLEVLRWVPLVVSAMTVVAFAWLAHRSLTTVPAVGATFAYALMPSAYGWLVAGGGLPRGFGLLFALLAAAAVAQRSVDRPRVLAISAGILIGLSALSHPQSAVLAVVACLVLSFQRPLLPWLANLGIAAVAAVATTLPWLIWVAGTNGIDAIVGAAGRLEPAIGIIRMLNLEFSAAPFMDVVGVVGVVGVVAAIVGRAWRLLVLLLAIYLVGSGGGEFLAAAPWALLAGLGAGALLNMVASALTGAHSPPTRRVLISMSGAALFLSLIGSIGSVADRSSKLHALGEDRVAAMEWASVSLPADARLIVPNDEVWGFDDIGEWLPAIANRQTLGIVQGSEWLGTSRFDAQLAAQAAIRGCAGSTAICYRGIEPDTTLFIPKGQVNGVFSPTDCCPALRSTLTEAGYEIIYDGPGATIAQPSG